MSYASLHLQGHLYIPHEDILEGRSWLSVLALS